MKFVSLLAALPHMQSRLGGRVLLLSLPLALLLTVVPAAAQQYDLLLKGGHVIDPANKIDRVVDIAVREGKIAKVAADIPTGQAKKTIKVGGYYVTPGLVDTHTYVFGYQGWRMPGTPLKAAALQNLQSTPPWPATQAVADAAFRARRAASAGLGSL